MIVNRKFESSRDLFFRSLKYMGESWNMWEPGQKYVKRCYLDNRDIGYGLNSYNFRSEEFDGTHEVLALGCSQTFGLGMSEESIWPSLFAKSVSKRYASLASPGDSAQGQITKAFKYFEEFGNPKIIIASFPQSRMELPAIPKKFGAKSANFDSVENISETVIQKTFQHNDKIVEYAKYPYNPEQVIPEEISAFYTYTFIKILEQYCLSNKIIFIYNIWNSEQSDFILENFPNEFNNASFLKPHDYVCDCPTNEDDLWNLAADGSHWGKHQHMHIFQEIYSLYKEGANRAK